MADAVARDADALMGRLLELTEQSWISATQVSEILAPLRLPDVEAEIYVLRELAEVVRAMPLKIYKDAEQRGRLIDAVQDALDEAIDREESEL